MLTRSDDFNGTILVQNDHPAASGDPGDCVYPAPPYGPINCAQPWDQLGGEGSGEPSAGEPADDSVFPPRLNVGQSPQHPPFFHHDLMLRSTIEAISSAVAVLDGYGRIIIVNQEWRRLARADDWPSLGDGVREISRLTAEGGRKLRMGRNFTKVMWDEWLEAETPFFRTEGADFGHYRMHAAYLAGESGPRVLVVLEDVTDTDKLNHQIRLIAQKLTEAEERERRRLAREIHDTTAQDLIAIGFDLRRAGNLTTDPQMLQLLEEIGSMLRHTQASIRTTSFLLHPPVVGRGGLSIELEALVRGLAHRMDAEILLESTVKERLSPDAELALYRVVQEALTNVHRHAAASHVVVRCRKVNRRFIVEVQDDGIGVGRNDTDQDAGVGIPGMKARLREIGGRLTISRLCPGTLVRASVEVPTAGKRLGQPGDDAVRKYPGVK